MSMKKRVVLIVICSLLALVFIYTGICFVATLSRALTQAYLQAKTVNYYFMGYFMTDIVYGIVFIVSGILLFFALKRLIVGYFFPLL